jgi:hypothetical protein
MTALSWQRRKRCSWGACIDLAVIEVGGHKERDDHLDERRDTLLIPLHGLPPMMAMPQGWHSGVASASARPSDAGLRLRSSDEGQ